MRYTSISAGSRSEPTGKKYSDGHPRCRHTAMEGEPVELLQLLAETPADALLLGRFHAALGDDPEVGLWALLKLAENYDLRSAR